MERDEKTIYWNARVKVDSQPSSKKETSLILYNPRAIIPYNRRGYDDSHYNGLKSRIRVGLFWDVSSYRETIICKEEIQFVEILCKEVVGSR